MEAMRPRIEARPIKEELEISDQKANGTYVPDAPESAPIKRKPGRPPNALPVHVSAPLVQHEVPQSVPRPPIRDTSPIGRKVTLLKLHTEASFDVPGFNSTSLSREKHKIEMWSTPTTVEFRTKEGKEGFVSLSCVKYAFYE